MTEEFSVKNLEFLKDRAYYSKIPKHALLLPDGSRRYAHKEELSDMYVYDITQRKCQEFLEVCFNEYGLDTVSIFALRPTSFDMQRRTNKNLEGILIAGNRLVNEILQGSSLVDSSLVYIDTITLAGKPWMDKPERIIKSERLSELWDTLKNTLEMARNLERKRKKINLLINYSGREEIDYALKGNSLQIPEQIGVVIRVGDSMRLSDCPLYALSETHLHLIPKFLPETTKDDFREALSKYYNLFEQMQVNEE